MDNLEPITRNEMFLNGDDLEPITREEMILAGADLEPLTRHEWFLKKYRGSGDVTIKRLAVTENGTYSESGKAYSPVVVNVPAPPIPENAYLLNDLSDLPADIASFTDGTDLPMASLKVAVTPYQDLHGQDAPWAGGAGKNKFNIDDASVGGFDISGETFTNNATDTRATAQIIVQLYNGTTYVKSSDPATGEYPSRCYCNISIDSAVTQLRIKHNGSTRDLVIYLPWTRQGNYTISFLMPQNNPSTVGGLVIKDIMICENNYYTPYLPYSNICPIIGWDEAVVSVSGINVWDEEWEVGSIDSATGQNITNNSIIRSKNYIPVVPNVAYYFKSPDTIGLRLYDADKNYINSTVQTNLVYTIPNGVRFIRFIVMNTTTYNDNVSINYPSTDHAYHAYNGATYTIDLNGTKYGGTLDATDGTFLDMIDHIASYNGEELPPAWISDRDVYAVGTTPTIGAEVVYTRATPITVQLSPTAVKSLVGTNNIFANCGQITEVKYFKKA